MQIRTWADLDNYSSSLIDEGYVGYLLSNDTEDWTWYPTRVTCSREEIYEWYDNILLRPNDILHCNVIITEIIDTELVSVDTLNMTDDVARQAFYS